MTTDNLLFLAHRLPYPPNKGDKLRAYQLLKFLARDHRVFLGTFVDALDDWPHVDSLRTLCAEVCAVRLVPWIARLRSLSAFVAGEPLTVPYYRDRSLRNWIAKTVREHHIDCCVVFSSAMAQYVVERSDLGVVLIDFVDVDSEKWNQYAMHRTWPLSWLYHREGRRLLAFERDAARQAIWTFFVTDAETDLFRRLAPESASKAETLGNGVDTEHFSPDHAFDSPYAPDAIPVVFTGAMDYWPNVDAVRWFATEMLPSIRRAHPRVTFTIVGMRPRPDVLALAGDAIKVTGFVSDVRPYLRHASVVVAPMRIARGIQNKVLEAMAMGRAVVASTACAAGIDAVPGRELLTADDPSTFVDCVVALLESPERRAALGAGARNRVHERYSWAAQLSRLGQILGAPGAPGAYAA